jgi:hypothetical protein
MADEPELLDLSQFASLDDAISNVQTGRIYEEVSTPYLQAIHADGRLFYLDLFFMSAITRARSLHEGIAREIAAANPHATFPLIRQFAETVALVFYVSDHPAYVNALTDRPRDLPRNIKRKTPQALVNYMSKHARHFGEVYAELCEITHYGSTAMWSTIRPDKADPGHITWSSKPDWRDERQALIACAQTLELVDAMQTALKALGHACEVPHEH